MTMIKIRKPQKEGKGKEMKTTGDKQPQGRESTRQQLPSEIENIKSVSDKQERTYVDKRSSIGNGRDSSR